MLVVESTSHNTVAALWTAMNRGWPPIAAGGRWPVASGQWPAAGGALGCGDAAREEQKTNFTRAEELVLRAAILPTPSPASLPRSDLARLRTVRRCKHTLPPPPPEEPKANHLPVSCGLIAIPPILEALS